MHNDKPIERWRRGVRGYLKMGYTVDRMAKVMGCDPRVIEVQLEIWRKDGTLETTKGNDYGRDD